MGVLWSLKQLITCQEMLSVNPICCQELGLNPRSQAWNPNDQILHSLIAYFKSALLSFQMTLTLPRTFLSTLLPRFPSWVQILHYGVCLLGMTMERQTWFQMIQVRFNMRDIIHRTLCISRTPIPIGICTNLINSDLYVCKSIAVCYKCRDLKPGYFYA